MLLLLFYKNLLSANWIAIRNMLYWALIWLLIGALTSLIFPSLAHFLIATMVKFFQHILGNKEPTISFSTAWIIFSQNTRAALVMLFLGIILGILPRLSIAFNALVVGVLFTTTLLKSVWAALFFILVIIPHGVFEITALIISAAFGVQLGWFWKIPAPDLTLKQKFLLALKQNVQLVPLIVLLLIIAAGMEVWVSGALSQSLSNHFKALARY